MILLLRLPLVAVSLLKVYEGRERGTRGEPEERRELLAAKQTICNYQTRQTLCFHVSFTFFKPIIRVCYAGTRERRNTGTEAVYPERLPGNTSPATLALFVPLLPLPVLLLLLLLLHPLLSTSARWRL